MTIGTHTPTTWNTLLSSTMHNYRDKMTDNVFDSRPLLNFIKSRKRTVSGGISIVEPLLYAEGDFTPYAEWDPVSVTPVNTLTAAQFDWKLLAGTVAISGLEEAQNNSKEMQVNLLEAKIEQQESTIAQNMNRMMFGTYTYGGGIDIAANGFTPFTTLVSNATVSAGGIVNEAWWASQDNDGTLITDAATLEAALRNAYNNSSDAGNDRVDGIFTNAYGFGLYEGTLTPQVRYTDTAKANLGFQNLMFKNVPMFWDFDCPGADNDAGTTATSTTQACYIGLNSKYVGLVCHSDRDMAQSPFTDNLAGNTGGTGAASGVGTAATHSIDARVSYNTTYGNTTIRNRRRCFKVRNVSF